jgi:hypothetical protein
MALIDRAKNMITTPKTEWAVVAAEEPNQGGMVTGYALPLILLGAVAAFIGYGFIGHSVLGVRFAGVSWGLYQAVMQIIFGLAGVYITSFVVNALAPSFGSQKDAGRAMQLVVYSMTPAWIGGILSIFPPIAWLGMLFGIYSLYLIYLGLPHTMKTPQDKVAIYMIVTIVVLIVVYFIIGAVLAAPLMRLFGVYTVSTLNFNM